MAKLPVAPVRQIVLNLLLNAGAAAGRAGKVGLSVTGEPGGLRLSISDTGPGFSSFDLARLMGSGPLPPGGGVGLRLVGDLVDALDGRLTHDRRAGTTEIRVDLPVLEPADA